MGGGAYEKYFAADVKGNKNTEFSANCKIEKISMIFNRCSRPIKWQFAKCTIPKYGNNYHDKYYWHYKNKTNTTNNCF